MAGIDFEVVCESVGLDLESNCEVERCDANKSLPSFDDCGSRGSDWGVKSVTDWGGGGSDSHSDCDREILCLVDKGANLGLPFLTGIEDVGLGVPCLPAGGLGDGLMDNSCDD